MAHRINVGSLTPWKEFSKAETDRTSGKMIGTLTIANYRLAVIEHGVMEIPYKKLREIERVEAHDDVPAYDVVRLGHVMVHFHDGVEPDSEGLVVGRIEIDAKFVTPSRTDGVENAHLLISVRKLGPAASGEPEELRVKQCTWYQEPDFLYSRRFGPDSKDGNVFVL